MSSAVSGVRLLCPSCRTALAEELTCPTCLAAFRQDSDSGAFILCAPSEGGQTQASTPWDEIYGKQPVDLNLGSNIRIKQRRLMVDKHHVSKRILDIGVGTGFNVALLDAAQIEVYVGIDLSLVALRHAGRVLSSFGVRPFLICCDASRFLPLDGRFDTILCFGFLYQFAQYRTMLEAILSAHSEAGTVVYGTEPIHAVGSRYHIRRSQLLKTLRTHGMVQAYFLEGLIHRLATKLSAPEWFLRHSALWAIPSPHLTPFSHYMQYVVRVTHV